MSHPHPAIERNARASAEYTLRVAEARAVLSQAAAEFGALDAASRPRISQASSLGAEDMVITHLINSLQLDVDIFVLETGRLHTQTLELLQRLQSSSRAPVTAYYPRTEAVVEFVAREGANAMYKSLELRKACCHIRKMEPLERALTGKDAWITGLRREQSGARAEVLLVEPGSASASSPARTKINPLANWTWGDVWHYIAENQVTYNPLHDAFFPSIGCEPCTRAISLGEDFRSGRWWWEDEAAKECGLHVAATSTLPSDTANTKTTA